MKLHQSSHVHDKALLTRKSRLVFHRIRAVGAAGVAAALLLPGSAVPGVAPTVVSLPIEAGRLYQAPLRTAIDGLVVSDEVNEGYDRDRYFGSWTDTDGDCQNTRQEVLADEATGTLSDLLGGCEVSTGRWITSWDNRVHTSASGLQIDHTVPVHEAWGSGARYWTQSRRVAYYNDLGDPRTLNAQTAALNVDKNGQSPQNWMPPANRCAYIEGWVAVKIRWGLTVNSGEKATLVHYANSCQDVPITVIRV
jgi:hypothetical protein